MGKNENKQQQNSNKTQDEKQKWLETHLKSLLKLSEKDIQRLQDTDEYRKSTNVFFESADCRHLFVYFASATQLTIATDPPQAIIKKGIFFTKTKKTKVLPENINQCILYGDISQDPINDLSLIANEIFLPVISGEEKSQEASKKEILNQFNRFLSNIYVTIGQAKGKTLLPLPPTSTTDSEVLEVDKDKIHTLETAVILWTNQIKEVLKTDPENLFRMGKTPGPLQEIEFWGSKAANLDYISEQLNSEKVKKVIDVLTITENTYIPVFLKLIEEVKLAREEAHDNFKYLSPLKPYFEQLRYDSPSATEFTECPTIFKKIFHLIFLIWTHSNVYNTPRRLAVLIREICNDLIELAKSYVNGREILQIEYGDAIERLETARIICGQQFKDYYRVYKEKVGQEIANNKWRIKPGALFHRLDQFLERCRDILELIDLIIMFNKLSTIEIGGTKGKVLTDEVRELHEEFMQAVQRFKEVQYDVLDISLRKFDEDFFEFKLHVKELERKLGSILARGFEDCNSITAAFKLVESFSGLIDREILQQDLEKKQSDIIKAYRNDLYAVQQLFQTKKDEPPLFSNMPPTAGALVWCQALMERIDHPMRNFEQHNKILIQTPEGKELIRLHSSIINMIREYRQEKYKQWAMEVGTVSEEKLQKNLLVRSESGLLNVNFDPALVRMLREVSYIQKLNQENNSANLDIPEEALQLFSKIEVFRTQTGNLHIIANLYNKIQESLLDVEKPLLKQKLEHIDSALEEGINSLTWRSAEIDEFISKGLNLTSDANSTLTLMKNNLEEIQVVFSKWKKNPAFERKETRTLTLSEFNSRYEESFAVREQEVAKGAELVHRKLTESFSVLKDVDKTCEEWKNYESFITKITVDGIVEFVVASIQALKNQMDRNYLQKNEILPMQEVSLRLSHGEQKIEAEYVPSLEENLNGGESNLFVTVNKWLDDFVKITSLFSRIDDQSGNYQEEVKERAEIKALRNDVLQLYRQNIEECKSFKQIFLKLSYLWESDPEKSFANFLKEHEDVHSSLPKFNEEICKYEKIQDEIDNLVNSYNTGWIRVDARPIKAELKSLCDKWKNTYVQYLMKKVNSNLSELYEFMSTVMAGLEKDVPEGDVDSLKEVIGYIRSVRVRIENESNATGMIDKLKDISSLLKNHGSSVGDEMVTKLEDAPDLWNQLWKKAMNRRSQLSPLQDREAKKMKDQILEFNKKVTQFRKEFEEMPAFFWEIGIDDAYKAIDTWNTKLKDIEAEALNLKNLQELFELTVFEYRDLQESREDIVQLKTLWDMAGHVMSMFKDWMKTSFSKVDVDLLVDEARKLKKHIQVYPVRMKTWESYKGLFGKVSNMLTALPLVQDLRSDAMRDRHWKELLRKTNKTGDIDPKSDEFSLEQLLDLGLHDHVETVRTIVDQASKELAIEKKLSKIESVWEDEKFVFTEHEEFKSVMLGPVDIIIENLEDNQVQLQNLVTMRYVEYFIEKVTKWQMLLGTVDSIITLWNNVQKKWSNLYPIFVLSEDIRVQLPEDAVRFQGADTTWRELMNVVKEIPNVIYACTSDVVKQQLNSSKGFNDILASMQKDLEQCEKALADYLETKRRAFPRFYFVAPADLVDILSKGSFPHKVMKHMAKLVDAIKTLTFKDKNSNEAVGLVSCEEEVVNFTQSYKCEGSVENWLNGILDTIRQTLAHILTEAHSTYIESSRENWLLTYPAQLVIVASRIWFTSDVNQAFERQDEGNKNALKEFSKIQIEQLTKLTQLVQSKKITAGERKKIITLITVDVHNRDIVLKLIDEKAENSQVFTWQSQLRYSLGEERGCMINIADAEFNYNHEYIGNCGCLVITPLTDRCYITLTQSLRLIMGGAPAGPAGTGKTETTKDLGRALGTAVYVFNCTEQMDYLSLGNIFKGLAMTGTWGCFDEFNRVKIGVLSVVATQFKSILDAIRAKKDEFVFQHQKINLIRTCGVFITMNPGYKGRTELPENLKALFRPCAMIVPDLLNICEIMLASEGFAEAKMLAKKFVTLYKLNRELLSKQDHYDWGLRAIKSVLVIAGGLKRAEPQHSEEMILMRALRDTNLAKLSRDDISIFLKLISDLFPNLDIPPKQDPQLVEALKKASTESNLQFGENDIFIKKCVQFKELLDVRHSVFVLGPAGSAKSCVWKTLAKGMLHLGQKTWFEVLDPKAVTSYELYGYIHPTTRDPKDGLLSFIMREMSNSDSKNPKWIVLDGDIDADWIESMNTVMDDNKVLTLASNERIPLNPTMRMIFEISHLKNATPATVSRAGILFLNETDVGWQPFKESWIEQREDEREKQNIERLFEKYVPPTLEWIRKFAKHIIPIPDINMIQTLCNLLEGLMTPETCPKGSANEVYEHFFVFASIWAFGGALPSEANNDMKMSFSNWWRKNFNTVKFPENGTVFDYFVAKDTKMESWNELVEPYTYEDDITFGEITVETSDTVRLTYVMNLLADKRRPVLLVGTAGTGKTSIVKRKLVKLDEETIYSTINLNSMTDSKSLQAILEQSIERKAGKRYGPPGRKHLIYFIDDLNMPNPDKYGTQSAISLLRQHIDYGYWYDRSSMTVKEVGNVQYICCMNPKAGSFTVDDRLQRHFGIFAVNFPSPSDLSTIYSQILKSHTKNFDTSVSSLSNVVVKASIDLHQQVCKTFLPTATKFHYQFNLRELSNIFQGLCLSRSNYYKIPGDLIKLWLHECQRVFSDRLTVPEDVTNFNGLVTKVAQKHFEIDNIDTLTNGCPLIYTSFMKQSDDGEMVYIQAPEINELKEVLEAKLTEYNADHPIMNLELFEQAIQHVCRISRIIFNPKGNALLVGVGGSGKQSLARLASFINGYEIYEITVTSTYSIIDFKNSLITLYKNAGQKGQDYTFILTDSQIVNEKMLVFINDLLSSGYIPELFTQDEKDQISQSMQMEMKSIGRDFGNIKACWEYFIEKVRNKLHIIMCFSPVGPQFRTWCRKFPAIINCTTIDWFHRWPKEALISVATRFLGSVELSSDELRLKIAHHMAFVHESVEEASIKFQEVERRYNYVTPKSFLELIEIYKSLLDKKRKDLFEKIDRLNLGLQKIKESANKVSDLQLKLKQDQVVVEEQRVATQKLLEKVGKDKAYVEEQKRIAQIEEDKTNKLVKEVGEYKASCEEDLAKAEPLVQRALSALDTLQIKDIQELKALTSPPEDVGRVTSAVLILTADGKRGPPKNPAWNDARKAMQNPGAFLTSLKQFDKENIPSANIDALQPYLSNPQFNEETVRTKSTAAGGLCSWVINIVHYSKINAEVEPKRQKLKEATDRLEASKSSLKKIQDKVKDLQSKLDILLGEYETAMKEKEAIEAEAKKTEDQLSLAHRLVNGLENENTRWAQSTKDLKTREETLVGDVLLAAAFLSYVGSFTKEYRTSLVQETWIPDLISRQIPTTTGIDPLFGVLTEEAQVAQWNNESLPSDRVSIENGAIVCNCNRWPLLIDPQLQGIKWLKNKEEKNGLKIIQLTQPKYLDAIEQAISLGQPIIIQNIGETIDSVLEPLLSRSFITRGRTTYIRLGSSEVAFDPKFRLYLQTKMSNPHYRPEIVAQTTLLNFMVTEAGLEDQLLATVVNQERPELEEQRVKLLRDMNQFKIDLKKCEDDLLMELTKSKGNILENRALIENLENTKLKAEQIMVSVKETQVTSEKIDKNRLVYTPVAVRGSLLFFLMDSLSTIDHMYQYSLEAFSVVFNKALAKAKQATNIKERVDNIIDSITSTLFSYVTRGLFERHKLIFSAMLCFGILKKMKTLDPIQLDFLLRGPKKLGVERPETVVGWCSEVSWGLVQALTDIEGTSPPFSALPSDMAGSWRRWKEWCEFEKPEEKPLPLEWKNLDTFQKLLVIKCLRPDRITMAVTKFVEEKIGKKYVEELPVDLESSFADSGPITPIFFILSPGVDPVKAVESLGEKLGFTESAGKFKNVSLGQGQEQIAEEALQVAFQSGGWVMLNNLHLTPEWLVQLEKKLDHFSEIFTKQRLAAQKRSLSQKPATENEENKDIVSSEEKTPIEKEKQETPSEGGEQAPPQDKQEASESQQDKNTEVNKKEEIIEDEEQEKGHEDLRIFLSAEPSNKIPLGVLQRSIKLTNEPPRGLKANLFRGFLNFNDNTWENSPKQTEFKAILFALCFFHAAIVERKKFGPQGWNRNYPFNLGDLTTCIAVLNNYLEDRQKIPWDDLRYVFGEIMYGGHITDDIDRRLCMTYLSEYIRQEIVERIDLCPGFLSPPTTLNFQGYIKYVEEELPGESPTAYGLHPNAEIGFRTQQGDILFSTIMGLQPKSSASGEGQSADSIVKDSIENILSNLPEQYNIDDISERLDDDRTPFQNSFYQECEYMNALLAEIQRSLEELRLGLAGDLTMSDKMIELYDCIYQNKVPETWLSISYPSMRPLDTWFSDLLQRCMQLTSWTADLATPKVVWISGLFNPQSFLTAIMQSTARKNGWPLDKMSLSVEVTKKQTPDEIDAPAREGAFIYGLYLEGATWDMKKGVLTESKLKELHPKMPVMHIKAAQADKADPSVYECPVYKTQERGPYYVFSCKLKTKEPPSKWILGGVGLLCDVVE